MLFHVVSCLQTICIRICHVLNQVCNKFYNIAGLQLNDFYSVEGAMRLFLDDNLGRNRRIRWSVLLTYANEYTGRPSEMLFIAECYDDNRLVLAFIGHNTN
jgi:hypothetical protein